MDDQDLGDSLARLLRGRTPLPKCCS